MASCLADQRQHFPVHIRYIRPDSCRHPAPVAFVIQSDTLCQTWASARYSLFIAIFLTYTAGATTTAAGTILPIPMDFPNSPYRIESNPGHNYTCYNHLDSFPAGTPQVIRRGLPVPCTRLALVAKMVYRLRRLQIRRLCAGAFYHIPQNLRVFQHGAGPQRIFVEWLPVMVGHE